MYTNFSFVVFLSLFSHNLSSKVLFLHRYETTESNSLATALPGSYGWRCHNYILLYIDHMLDELSYQINISVDSVCMAMEVIKPIQNPRWYSINITFIVD